MTPDRFSTVTTLGTCVFLAATLLLGSGETRAQRCDSSADDMAIRVDSRSPDPGRDFLVTLPGYGDPLSVHRQVEGDGTPVWIAQGLRPFLNPSAVIPTEASDFESPDVAWEQWKASFRRGQVMRLSVSGSDECFAVYRMHLEQEYWSLELKGLPNFGVEYEKNCDTPNLWPEMAPDEDPRRLERLPINCSVNLLIYEDPAHSLFLFPIEIVEPKNLNGSDIDLDGLPQLLTRDSTDHRAKYSPRALAHKILEARLAALRASRLDEFEGDPYLAAAREVQSSRSSSASKALAVDRLMAKCQLKLLEVCSPSCSSVD